MKIRKINNSQCKGNIIYLADKAFDFSSVFSGNDLSFIKKSIENKLERIELANYPNIKIIQLIEKKDYAQELETARKEANKAHDSIMQYKPEQICLMALDLSADTVLAYAEGIALSNYQFLKYYSDADDKKYSLSTINISDDRVKESNCIDLQNIIEAVNFTRTLINEPLSFLTATQLSLEIQKAGNQNGFNVEVFDKRKIESLKMGGLLAVNKGSIDPPTFTILEWKPENAVNDKAYVLVGKGVVYDTGGLSLKPTPESMDLMKSDMSGAAAVAGTIYAVSKAKLPVHIIGLIPATDNRPDGNAYAPGDVIKMFTGLTVEVLNTDAEGRMILADALGYASKYEPQLVIDLATLTGAAAVAIGKEGIVGMGNKDSKDYMLKLQESGKQVYERIVEFPLWDEYAEMIKSDIADIKNIGGREAGAITAGKFLQRFTSYPWIHLDIAGPAYGKAANSYHGKGGSGIGVRLLFDFFKKMVK